MKKIFILAIIIMQSIIMPAKSKNCDNLFYGVSLDNERDVFVESVINVMRDSDKYVSGVNVINDSIFIVTKKYGNNYEIDSITVHTYEENLVASIEVYILNIENSLSVFEDCPFKKVNKEFTTYILPSGFMAISNFKSHIENTTYFSITYTKKHKNIKKIPGYLYGRKD